MCMNANTAAATPPHWMDRTTLTVEEAGQILGICRSSAYEAVKRGQLPAIKVVGRLVVPVPRLMELLGYSTPPAAA